jgi:hypothetical protein
VRAAALQRQVQQAGRGHRWRKSGCIRLIFDERRVPAVLFGYCRDFWPGMRRCATLHWRTLNGKPL